MEAEVAEEEPAEPAMEAEPVDEEPAEPEMEAEAVDEVPTSLSWKPSRRRRAG